MIFCVSDGNGYSFLQAKKIDVNAATKLLVKLMQWTRPKSEYLVTKSGNKVLTSMNFF